MLPSIPQLFFILSLIVGTQQQQAVTPVVPSTTTISTTTTTVSPGGVAGIPVIQPIISGATIDCTRVANSNQLPDASGAGCTCLGNYVWNGTNCIPLASDKTIVTTAIVANSLNCSAIPKTLGNNGLGCICQPGYTWDQGSNSCLINCNLINNTLPWGPRQGSSCLCIEGYIWTVSACVRNTKLINCAAIANADLAYPQTPDGGCVCLRGFRWQNITQQCLSSLNCTKRLGTIGPASNDRCQCQPGFTWLDSECRINCLGSYSISNLNATHCKCMPTSSWNNTLKMCVENCNGISNHAGNDAKSGSCICPPSFVRVGSVCTFSCNGVPNSNNNFVPKKANECQCLKGFEWDHRSKKCNKRKGLSLGQKIGLGIGIPLAILSLAGLAFCCWRYYDSKRPPAQHQAVEQVPVTERNIHHPGKTNPTIVTQPHIASEREMVYLPNMVSSHKVAQPTVQQTSNIGPYGKTHVSTVIEAPHPVNIPSTIPTASAAMLPSHSNVAGSAINYLDQKVGQMYLNAEKGARDVSAGVQNYARESYNNVQQGLRQGINRPASRSPRNNSP